MSAKKRRRAAAAFEAIVDLADAATEAAMHFRQVGRPELVEPLADCAAAAWGVGPQLGGIRAAHAANRRALALDTLCEAGLVRDFLREALRYLDMAVAAEKRAQWTKAT